MELVIRHPQTQEPTTWIWTLYGPGHPNTVQLATKLTRRALRELADQKQAQVNGKKWKAEDQSYDELHFKNVESIVARTKTFTPVKIGAETTAFTPEGAQKLLSDRKMSWLFNQLF